MVKLFLQKSSNLFQKQEVKITTSYEVTAIRWQESTFI